MFTKIKQIVNLNFYAGFERKKEHFGQAISISKTRNSSQVLMIIEIYARHHGTKFTHSPIKKKFPPPTLDKFSIKAEREKTFFDE